NAGDHADIAADAEAFDIAALAGVPAELHGVLRFDLHPSAQLIVSMFHILHIWRANQPGGDADERIDLHEGGDTLLVVRRPPPTAGIAIERISGAEGLLLASLGAGCTLEDAANRCSAMSPGFELAATLRRHVADRPIVGFRAPTV